jgi:hypothetical protein
MNMSKHEITSICTRLMATVAIGTGAVVAGAYAWVLMASLIFCFGVHHPELLTLPYTQWMDAASLFYAVNWQIKMWLVTAAVPPSAIVLIALKLLVPFGRSPRQPLYGASQWADPGQMRAGGVQPRRAPSGF